MKVMNFRFSSNRVKNSFIFGIASISSLTIILLGLFIVPAFTSQATYADDPSTDPTISIIPAGDLPLNMNPGASGSFGVASANVTISTTNITGYTLTMNTETTDTDLKNNKIDYTDPTKADLKITNLSTTTAESSFANNKWGYNVSKSGTYIKGAANTYVPVPNSESQQSDKEVEVTDAAGSSTYTFNYGVKADLSLPSGDYSNTLVYSATANEVPEPTTLYETVASMSKGTQTLADMQAVITKPTSSDPTTDTSNSGVYKYDATTFGTASDAANTHDIYYYRGILDSNLTEGTYYNTTAGYVGSSGDGAYYPNYVVLSSASDKSNLTTSDTCWRIVRTTGSGGVKMIYNGKWTGSTCANANADAVSSVYFNRRNTSSSTNDYDTDGRIIYVGYNRSSTSSHQTGTSSVANSTLFVNRTKSNLRTQLESWYASNMTSYTSKLETNAGWCDDRTTYNGSYASTSSTVPYATSSATVNFGAYKRNRRANAGEKLSLTCTNTADRLTTSNGMSYPAAPLTADEAALAGSGYAGTYGSTSAYSSNYHYNSYLRSSNTFWLFSGRRSPVGTISACYLSSGGALYDGYVSNTAGVRPTISLNPGTTAVSGTGTATDPWIVNP